ncbi:hypothetical protein [uncultured Alsobacter sp.]|uniref:hypothetical protein n=1 Tax=uncultured Alsobacter sp. TaxID=1748258 RepID=UPI0025E5EB1B|nr:hypothetical protein [uncultured Alsobacter sp.]
MQDIVAALVSFFLIQPLQAEMAETLATMRAPSAVVAQVAACAQEAAPAVARRAMADPLWAAGTVVSVWIGQAQPEALLVEVVPGCAPAVTAARPFLRGDEV